MGERIDSTAWVDRNHGALVVALDALRERLDRHAQGGVNAEPSTPDRTASTSCYLTPAEAARNGPPAEPGDATATIPSCPSLDALGAAFGLSVFERQVVLLAAGAELDARIGPACAAAQGGPARPFPTWGLALAALSEPHWSALTPSAPLRRWRLIEAVTGTRASLTQEPLKADERILHFLAGVEYLDEQLEGLIEPVSPPARLVPSHDALARRIVASWSRNSTRTPVLLLCGADDDTKRDISAAASAAVGLGLAAVALDALPTDPGQLLGFTRLWEREAALSGTALYVDASTLETSETPRVGALVRLVHQLAGVILIGLRDPIPGIRRPLVRLEVRKPTASEQRELWRSFLGDQAITLNAHIDTLSAQFDLSATAIGAAVDDALQAGQAHLADALWDASRARSRVRLQDLAERIEPAATWEQLVLPDESLALLRLLAAQLRHRTTVYERWGFAELGCRGLGISALFTGPSGTGKTMAAEVLTNELRLDLYRIDLSGVVSKYIGETEKNLRRVFDAAEEGGAALFFDEADALFGKRSEVKDSHDRYANIEVNYLLQRMEAYRGVVILATNLKGSLDPAFLRRIRFVVSFPFPDVGQRTQIWRRTFPAATPTQGLEPDRLAQLTVTGGNIRNIAINAAFLAAAEDAPIRMSHLLRAARTEFTKLERPLPDEEVRGWI